MNEPEGLTQRLAGARRGLIARLPGHVDALTEARQAMPFTNGVRADVAGRVHLLSGTARTLGLALLDTRLIDMQAALDAAGKVPEAERHRLILPSLDALLDEMRRLVAEEGM
ncbi:hypothetical protein [Citreimonas sp.]|uniref:hypothetical protein n=1 Tax=Citreimonas sp. TaxID=3036715 RepID=UPI0035C7F409